MSTVLVTLVAAVMSHSLAFVQPPNPWAPRERLPDTRDEARIAYMVSDQNQTVHAFFTQHVVEDEEARGIFYTTWTRSNGWAKAVDVILPPSPFGWLAQVMGVFLDDKGIIHLIYNGGNAFSLDIYYTSAPATVAGQARSWSEPVLIGPNVPVAADYLADLAVDNQGNLFIIYSGGPEGTALYEVRAEAGGESWSDPVPLFFPSGDESFFSAVDLHLDQQGRLHATWLANSLAGSGQSVYYARLIPDEEVWTEPIVMAQVGQYDYRLTDNLIGSRVEWPAITAHDDELMVFYTACEPCERRMRRSTDGGQTWADAVEPFSTRGSYGRPGFATDGENTLHMVLTDRARGTNLWHSQYREGRWQEPELLAPFGDSPDRLAGPSVPFHPNAIVSQGNLLLVSWSQDPGLPSIGVWYSYKQLEAPELPIRALPAVAVPTPAAVAAAVPTAAAAPLTVVPTQVPQVFAEDPSGTMSFLTQSSAFLVLGLAPTVLLITAVVIIQRSVNNGRRRTSR